jgi:transposase, IS5 family
MEADMSERTSKKPGIADYVAARRKRKDCFLDGIDRLIDWNRWKKCFAKSSSTSSTP